VASDRAGSVGVSGSAGIAVLKSPREVSSATTMRGHFGIAERGGGRQRRLPPAANASHEIAVGRRPAARRRRRRAVIVSNRHEAYSAHAQCHSKGTTQSSVQHGSLRLARTSPN